ncbi:MAG: PEGA domain-containing protein [Pseudomonadota bacterium]
MSVEQLLIRDVEGERVVTAAELPLRIGTGSDSDLRLPGPGGGALLVLDLLDGAPFLQPVRRDGSVTVNGEPLSASHRLVDGDVFEYFGSRIEVTVTDRQAALTVRLEDSAYVTRPPELPGDDAAAAEEAIAPTAFQRAAETRAVEPAGETHVLRWVIGSGLVVLAAAAWLLFTSKSIQFDVTPADPDSVSISGGWFKLPLGNRILLRPGEYTVTVEKAGYYDLAQAFVVDETPNKTIGVTLRRRPGSVTVSVLDEASATVNIDGTHVGAAPLGPVELEPGTYTLEVLSERYLPFSDAFELQGLGQQNRIAVQLVPRWSNVSISSEPSGASILADDEVVGRTPAVLELLEGKHTLSVVSEGFKAWDGTVVAEPNTEQTLPLIRLEEADARLRVNTIPRGANVTVDGRYRGQTPLTLDLSPDIDYSIGLSRAGYGSTTRRVRLQSAASEEITVDLSARTGRVTINVSPADARVYVDGRARGTGNTTLDLSSAPKRIEVRKPGYETWSRSVTPRPGYPQTLSARLRSEEAVAAASIQREQESSLGHTLRRIEAGSFELGASRREQGRRANEVIVPVAISKPFLIGVHEITNRQFAQFDGSHDSGSDIHPAMAGDNNPVANVTWAQAAQYCNWLSAREGLNPVYKEEFGAWVAIRPLPNGYRLPTEAEWAWAVRYEGSAGALRYPWGESWPPKGEAGNYADKSADGIAPTLIPGYDDGFASTAPVGDFGRNAAGIADGGGNVAEWVNDYYTVPTPGQTRVLTDPLGPERGKTRVIRGSSWRHAGMTELRLSYRDHSAEARPDVGFRIARNLDES